MRAREDNVSNLSASSYVYERKSPRERKTLPRTFVNFSPMKFRFSPIKIQIDRRLVSFLALFLCHQLYLQLHTEIVDVAEVFDKATAIIKKFGEGAGQEDFFNVPCYPTITTYCWNGDDMVKNKNAVEDFYYDSEKGLMMDVGEGFEVDLSELSDVEQLNVCQVIIEAAQANGIEL